MQLLALPELPQYAFDLYSSGGGENKKYWDEIENSVDLSKIDSSTLLIMSFTLKTVDQWRKFLNDFYNPENPEISRFNYSRRIKEKVGAN